MIELDFEELVDFIENRMRLSHIYQPLLIKTLVEAGGSATIRQIAHAFLSQDESQLIYYEDRIKLMPLKVLSNHGVVEEQGDLVSLRVQPLSLEQRARVILACEQRLQKFIQRQGLGIWDHRMLDSEPVPDSVRYEVLKESGGRCALCGVTKRERSLDVDHIVPHAKGGSNDKSNLQVLCSKCNRSKRSQDDTDFSDDIPASFDPNCPFCQRIGYGEILRSGDKVAAIADRYPVTRWHILIVPERHTSDYFSLTEHERQAIDRLLRVMRAEVQEKDSSVTGFNIGVNCGESAGQTVPHAHVHLIPRRSGDSENPRGGVRGVIPEMQDY